MIIRQAAFEGKCKMLKGNLHCHTTRSDGKGEPDVTVRQYGHMGYDFLALTDHRCYNYENYAPESGVVVIPAMEMDGRTEDPRVHCVHVVSVGPEKENGFAQDERVESLRFDRIGGGQKMIDMAHEANNLPIVCHPEWSGTGASELEEMKDFNHMEIWNSACAMGYRLDMYASYWDELLCHGRKIYGVASDDAHHIHQMGHGYIKVNAEKNVASILDALKKHQVPAAFFLVGHYIESNPDLVRRMVAEGHTVGNHTMHHYDMSKLSDKASFQKELSGLEELYRSVIGSELPRYYRPPQGIYSENNLEMAKKLGYKTVLEPCICGLEQ